jgi:hypothetical protein
VSHRLMVRRPMVGWLNKMTVKAAADIELDDYPPLALSSSRE